MFKIFKNIFLLLSLTLVAYYLGNWFEDQLIKRNINNEQIGSSYSSLGNTENKSIIPVSVANDIEIPYSNIDSNNFFLIDIDLSKPFSIIVPEQVVAGFGGQNINIVTPEIIIKYQSEEDRKRKEIFEDYLNYPAASLSYLTDNPEHFITLLHSGRVKKNNLPAEIFREWSKYKDLNASIDHILSIKQNDKIFEFRIIDLSIVSEDLFFSSVKYVTTDKPEFFELNTLGIPFCDKGKICITFAFCVERVKDEYNKYGLALPIQGTLTNRRGLLTLELISDPLTIH